jgi:hypothetical protein
VISPTQGPLPDNTQHSQETEIHPCPRRDSNPKFLQASGRRSTPSTALLLGWAYCKYRIPINTGTWKGGQCPYLSQHCGAFAVKHTWVFWYLSFIQRRRMSVYQPGCINYNTWRKYYDHKQQEAYNYTAIPRITMFPLTWEIASRHNTLNKRRKFVRTALEIYSH